MFKFDFEIEDEGANPYPTTETRSPLLLTHDVAQKELTLEELKKSLPEIISYSPHLLSAGSNESIPRRDLYDVRFQVISPETDYKSSPQHASNFVDGSSDIIPNIYEGGLKTWECSIDLANYLHTLLDESTGVRGKCILEIGCGTAVPSLYILHKLFSQPSREVQPVTSVHFQDFNASVLELVTFPNILLTWYFSAAAESFRGKTPEEGEFAITPEILDAFTKSLSDLSITLRFFSGPWHTFEPPHRYDLVLTSETIYRSEGLPSLISLLRKSVKIQDPETRESTQRTVEKLFQKISLSDQKPACLVAAKVLYFGVGGGVGEFEDHVKKEGGLIETVWEKKDGVGRRIMSVLWP